MTEKKEEKRTIYYGVIDGKNTERLFQAYGKTLKISKNHKV